MNASWRHVTQRMSIVFCSLLLVLVLAACGGSGGSTTGTATATPASATPTATTAASNPAASMVQYTGTTFSISYPQSWQKSASGNQVTFLDPISKNVVTIVTVANPAGAQSPSALADGSLPLIEKTLVSDGKNATVAPTVTINGETWAQRSATGTLALTDPGTPGTLFLLVNNHPASAPTTQAYEIYYYGPTSTFTEANTLAFQPMLQSFKFTA